MIEIVVWTAMLVGVQALMYWQAAAKIEELEHQIKQQEISHTVITDHHDTEIKELRLMVESLVLQQEQLFRDSLKTDRQRYEYIKSIPGEGDSKYIIT